ncbi:Chitin synthase, class 6 [Entomophthora muscae]|uniref:Chitin synthase, class 6 n=1 Tax=Entomophthora muscae TaxID=34485 RepID=A0ACC2UB10_9FUNG|nr:Chitin synthase, class 6 [Entomophthora muscae]
MAKVYTGLYECMGHVVPYLVVVKVGKPSERAKPGNRGKRDSQMILMRFFNKVHYDYPMVPLELEMYHQIKNVIGVDPHFYEFVLMVDADTVVMPDSLNRLVSAMLHDTKIMGLCGETALANEKDTWATMIQVYEYFISHHLSKAFESLFGSVTCLPGCFCMYRIRATNNQPLLVNNSVIHEYSENQVDTLHKKNLLHLGEDRYLTTLMLKHFPFFKMTFTPDAKCLTNAPDTWDVLLSQRRRWINSTVHNLLELVFLPRLCGFCCFSMRFVVFMDLLSTVIMPATLGYLCYLIYRLATDSSSVPILSLCFIVAPYAMQMIVFILWRQWQHIGWMIVYLLALPVFAFFIPIYAFWHFDDFSWGNTRVVVGEDGRRKKVLVGANADDGKFDAKAIPTKKWSEYEEELWEAHTEYSQDSRPYRLQQTSGSQLHTPQDNFYAGVNQRSSSHLLASPLPELPPPRLPVQRQPPRYLPHPSTPHQPPAGTLPPCP